VKPVLLGLIRFYQRFCSPLLGANCRFEPTCSRYTAQAIEVHGSIKGSLLGSWRILRCNPLSKGGQIDPVPPKGHWRAPNDLTRR
jgi:putative membrane protein insertion efficiency factor